MGNALFKVYSKLEIIAHKPSKIKGRSSTPPNFKIKYITIKHT